MICRSFGALRTKKCVAMLVRADSPRNAYWHGAVIALISLGRDFVTHRRALAAQTEWPAPARSCTNPASVTPALLHAR